MNVKIQNPTQAKAAGQAFVQGVANRQEKDKINFENIMKELAELNPQMGDFDSLAALLALPDEHFALLAPLFLREVEQGFNKVNDKMLIVRAMNASGLHAEDLQAEYTQICIAIDTQLEDSIPAPKRDFIKQILGITYNAAAETEGIAKKTLFMPIEYCREGAKMPEYAHSSDAGMDVFALEDVDIKPGETKLIPLGIKVAVPAGYELQVRPKSGRSLKSKLRIANTPGTIDAGYRDEIAVIAENTDQFVREAEMGDDGHLYNVVFGSTIHIGAGEKIAQLVLNEVPKACFYEVSSVLEVGENRGGGFGSTGLFSKTDKQTSEA